MELALYSSLNCLILDLFVKNKPSPTTNKSIAATKVGIIYAFAKSVFPNCQNPKLAIKKSIANKMKNRVEKTSFSAHSVERCNNSI